MPATEGDLAVVLSSNRKECILDLAAEVEDHLKGMVKKVEEVYSASVTESDTEIEEVPESIFIDRDEPDFTGGSFLFTQRYRFDPPACPGERFQEALQLAGRQNEMLVHALPYSGEQEQRDAGSLPA